MIVEWFTLWIGHQKLSSINNTLKENANIPKDFNLPQYLETIRERYGNLKLDSLETTSREHPVNLWQMFIPQNVRQVYQVLPELPKGTSPQTTRK